MVVIKVELWPMGNEAAARPLAEAHIANDGSGDMDTGNYWVKLFKRRGGIWRQGTVTGFPRRRLGEWDLLFRALLSCVGERNGLRR